LSFSIGIALWIALMVPIYRGALDKLYQAEGTRQSQLVETIHGMRTIKSLALESFNKKTWDDKTAIAVKRHASVGKIGILGNSLTTALEKVMQIVVLSVGAIDVFNGSLTIGGLVAFNMLSGRVIQPLLQIVALINEYQQASLSVRMLGTVMSHPPERDPKQIGMRPRIPGDITFDDVSFRYTGASAPAVDRVSFAVQEGQVVGIVGRSGSGKSTITRLIQGINTAQEGSVRLNGSDIRHIDLQHLRRSVGIVLQDNFLFRGTIRENIAAAKPDAVMEEVIEAARMAGAEEFIDRLPASYETMVEENAANFSGGQRQRLAIARALLTRPKLLIFDEATSALDPESETIIQRNLSIIAQGRTMVIVSHRLSSLVQADAILVVDQGKIMDFAPHPVLLDRCEIYRHLWQQQTKFVQ
jgi:ATP-binding cassette subfamily B protein